MPNKVVLSIISGSIDRYWSQRANFDMGHIVSGMKSVLLGVYVNSERYPMASQPFKVDKHKEKDSIGTDLSTDKVTVLTR